MNTSVFYIKFVSYLVNAIFKMKKLNYIKKHKNQEEAEKYLNEQVKKWVNCMIKITGCKVNVEGKENLPRENCLFVSNHQGYADIPVIMNSVDRPIGFVAKKEIEKYTIISSWMKEIHCVFMDRSNLRESIKAINEGIEILKNGYSMVIFPEGTRSKGGPIAEFKKGSLKLGIKADIPIVPIAINGSYKLYEENNGKVVPAEVKIKICEPIYAKNLTKEEQNNLAEIVRDIIKENM